MVFAADIFSKIFDGVEITDDENSTILSGFKFSPLVHIHKVTISLFPGPNFLLQVAEEAGYGWKEWHPKAVRILKIVFLGVDINEFEARDVTIKRFTLCGLGICYEF